MNPDVQSIQSSTQISVLKANQRGLTACLANLCKGREGIYPRKQVSSKPEADTRDYLSNQIQTHVCQNQRLKAHPPTYRSTHSPSYRNTQTPLEHSQSSFPADPVWYQSFKICMCVYERRRRSRQRGIFLQYTCRSAERCLSVGEYM
jgi:hypothetical protein